MSEAPAAIIAAAVAAVQADAEDVGVLSLLEGHNSHVVSSASLPLAAHASVSGEGLGVMVAPSDADSHRVRAVTALQQADTTASEHYRLVVSSLGNISQQQEGKQQFSLLGSMHPVSISSRSPARLPPKAESDMPTVSMPDADLVGERSITALAADFALASASPHSICLCQAPTRIPRPRNAFILFRQHHHAAVVVQNPGKSNPEVSKIIGQMWKGCSGEVKAVWQNHADEEKRQHLQRYPQYRYQPRRSGKKNALSVATPSDPTSPAPVLESATCPNCGGHTGALPTLPSASTTSIRKPSQSVSSTASRKQSTILDDLSMANGGGVAAGIEALIQLGLHTKEDDMTNPSLESPSKRRKLNLSMSPTSTSSLLQQSLFAAQFGHGSDQSIDPYLRQGSFDHQLASEAGGGVVGMGNGHHHHQHQQQQQLSHFGVQTSHDIFSIKAVPVLKKVHAINRMCPPISSLSVPPFETPAITRMPIVSVEGDDVSVVMDLFRALSMELKKSEPVYLIDEPDDLTVLSEAYLEGLLSSSTGLEKDKEVDDADAARYLSHAAFWRRKSSEIRRIVMALSSSPSPGITTPQTSSSSSPQATNSFEPQSRPQMVLINRYILSRSDAAALRLSTDGFSPLEHWQWCATVWRGCVGPDMTIYVQTLPEGNTAGDDAVETKDDGRVMFVRKAVGGNEWGDKVIRGLVFEIGELVRSLRGFPR